jgi:hypothetical protein
MTRKRKPKARRNLHTGGHRVLVYCVDDTVSVYTDAYGWWCMDCPAIREAEIDPTTKANADRDAKRHQDRERARTA